MANELDELSAPILEEGLDANVIAKKVTPKINGWGKFVAGFLNVLSFGVAKAKAKERFKQLEQRIQGHASTIDNYLDQRVQILKNTAKLLDKAIDLDKETFTKIAAYRSGLNPDAVETARNEAVQAMDDVFAKINVAMEKYPDKLQAHEAIESAMQQNDVLQRQIRAARDIYNDAITQWNTLIYEWPIYLSVAAKEQMQTRIPFVASKQLKEEARSTFF